jgi:hypothetical protein
MAFTQDVQDSDGINRWRLSTFVSSCRLVHLIQAHVSRLCSFGIFTYPVWSLKNDVEPKTPGFFITNVSKKRRIGKFM